MKQVPIKIILFKSLPRRNVFAPAWEFPIGEDKITGVNFKKIAKLILKKEKIILASPVKRGHLSVDAYTGLGKDSLTSRYGNYNLLDSKDKEIQKLKGAILTSHARFLEALKVPLYPELYIQCWANVMREGEQIKPHLHSVHENSYLGGHIVVQAQKTHTHYINPVNQINGPDIHSSSNIVGKISLFPSCVPHYTDMQKSGEPRITIAFDLFVNRSVVKPNYRKII